MSPEGKVDVFRCVASKELFDRDADSTCVGVLDRKSVV